MMRIVAILTLGLLLGAQAFAAGLMLDPRLEICQSCSSPGGDCGNDCVACPICASTPGDTVPAGTSLALVPVPGAPSLDVALFLPPACTEILHIPKPALS